MNDEDVGCLHIFFLKFRVPPYEPAWSDIDISRIMNWVLDLKELTYGIETWLESYFERGKMRPTPVILN